MKKKLVLMLTVLTMALASGCGNKESGSAAADTAVATSQNVVQPTSTSADKSGMTVLQIVNSHKGQTLNMEVEPVTSSAPDGMEVIDLGYICGYTGQDTTEVQSDMELVSGDRLSQLEEIYGRHNFIEYDIHIMAVGDDLMHTGVIETGLQSDGTYNYDALYQDIAPYLAIADLKVINQETIFGGDDREFTSYPTFNSPTAMGDAIVKAGFNLVLHATNHVDDTGISGINYCSNFWKTNYPDLMVIGLYGEEGKNDDIPLMEIEGVTFAVLNYTYGANAECLQYDLENHTELLTTYDASTRRLDLSSLNPDVIDDIQRAEQLADVVIVFPHWGVEYQTTENSYQDWVAEQMVEAGADIIIGTHPHVPQPVKWIESENGNRGLCYFSLGNYLSTQYYPDTLLEAMAWVTLHVGYEGIEIVESETGVLPMVLQYHTGPLRIDGVIAVENYTSELASAHGAQNRGGSYCSPEHFAQRSIEIFGENWILSISDILGE